jgi:hypothetical protein
LRASRHYAVQTIIIVALIGSPFRPVLKVKDLSREFWLRLLACSWWALAARAMIGILAWPAVLKKAPKALWQKCGFRTTLH